jgi:Cupin
MTAPAYNSRSTTIAVVVEGQGKVEIICPHLGKESESSRRSQRRERYEEEEEEEQGQHSQQGQRYQRIRSNLSQGTVFVVPAGHPTVAIASRNDNLQIMCFEIRSEKNERVFLAGKDITFIWLC